MIAPEESLRALLEAAAEAGARRALEAIGAAPGDALLDLNEVRGRFGVGRRAAIAAIRRGELVASHGPRRRILLKVRDVQAWLSSRPYQKPEPAEGTEELDPFERAVANGTLRVVRGAKAGAR